MLNLVSRELIDPNPREGTETFPEQPLWLLPVLRGLIDPNPREGTETGARRVACGHRAARLIDPNPREGTETTRTHVLIAIEIRSVDRP